MQNIDLSLPLQKLIAVTGVSGSGKSSLAFDTLYAEGQRRYIESFSAYARQFLERLEKPDADHIENIPPAIALKQSSRNVGARSTVATTTELHDYLRLLFARIGRIICPHCGTRVRRDNPETAADVAAGFGNGTRFVICFSVDGLPPNDAEKDHEQNEILLLLNALQEQGFGRVILDEQTLTIDEASDAAVDSHGEVWVVVDRLAAGKEPRDRVVDSLELAFRHGDDRALLLEQLPDGEREQRPEQYGRPEAVRVDERTWRVHRFNGRLVCRRCGRNFVEPEPRLFSFSSPLGACPGCRGFGSVPTISFEQVVPDASKSLREGAIVPWTTPAYRHELDELLALADDYGVPTDVPFSNLQPQHRHLIKNGVPERDFGGLKGFYRWLERHKYKLSVRVFLNRWRSYEPCPECGGDRLQPQALAVRIGGQNIAEACRRSVDIALQFFENLPAELSDAQREASRTVRAEITARLRYLASVGLGYITLERGIKSLSAGEAQRVRLTSLLGSNLVNALYVLDEPSAGMHARDSERVIEAIERLRDSHNTVAVVEHDDAFIRAADHVVDVGPGAGREGGRIVFQGTPRELAEDVQSLTGKYLSGRESIPIPAQGGRRKPQWSWLALRGARRHNLKNLTVKFPLGLLCVVTGVSGSGKSTLIEETLYPALCRALHQPCSLTHQADYDVVTGVEQIGRVELVDQSPIGRTPRSNPVTYLKVFDEIRKLFAKTPEARLRSYSATQFSFNAKGGGRCPRCNGSGSLDIEMQFLADVSMTCPECNGTRYKREILDIKYRGLTIEDTLNLTVREAFAFFRGQRRLQKKLKFLKDVGLDYLPLGQPATTLSGGESQRLKLAAHLAGGSRSRTLFLLDEPTSGLHPADVTRLLACFASLLLVGHSLIVVEHDLEVVKSADYVVDLGPEAGAHGGEVVAVGTPEEICGVDASITGRYLRRVGVRPARRRRRSKTNR